MKLIAVAIHDVAPESTGRCREIRDWLRRQGIARATLLAIPASLGSPCLRSPSHVAWLRECHLAGDAVAQHGLEHVQTTPTRGPRQWRARLQGGTAAEFVGLGRTETARALRRGRAILREAGVEPRGFVAPAYVYTPALRLELASTYDWWADLTTVWGRAGSLRSPALCLGASTRPKRAASPSLIRRLGRVAGSLMRVDVHPADLDHPRSRATLERLIREGADRTVVTYDELELVGPVRATAGWSA